MPTYDYWFTYGETDKATIPRERALVNESGSIEAETEEAAEEAIWKRMGMTLEITEREESQEGF